MTVLERGWLSSNNILLVGTGGTALIDSGYVSHAGQTVALVASALAGRTLDVLGNTHLHSDHCGGNAALQRAYPGMQTLIPPGQADAVRRWDPVALTYAPTGQGCPRFQFDALLEPGRVLDLGGMRWEVHAAPGHDPHSVVLFEPASRTLISADALWQRGFGVVFPELEGEPGFEEVARTLDQIELLRPVAVIPGHGSPFDEVADALAFARARLESMVKDPGKHARHAAKVLLKFKLLDAQAMELETLVRWAASAAYFGALHATWFTGIPFARWISELVAELVRSGAAASQGSVVLNS